MHSVDRHLHFSSHDNMEPSIEVEGSICPLTGSPNTTLLETFPTSLLIECYQRDFGLDVTSEFQGVKSLQLWRCLDSDLIFFQPTITGSTEFYRQIQNFDWYFPEVKFEYDHAATWIKPDYHVLDIGSGAGQFVKTIPVTSYTGLDPNYLPNHDKIHMNTRILRKSLAEHAMTNIQTYDVVCGFQVLEHVANPQAFIKAALKCLKPGGLLILGVPSAESYVTQIANFILNAPPHHVTWWTDQSLRNLAQHFQLSVLNLVHAPVESWETRLYWMQRMAEMFCPKQTTHFTESPYRRLSNIAAYVGAGLIMPFATPPASAQGSSVIMVAQKKYFTAS